MEWSSRIIVEFLQLYKMEPILWNPSHSGHKDRSEMLDAWRRIQYKISVPCTIEDLKRKKESLMAQFRTLLSKIRNSEAKASSSDEVFTPSWFAFNIMMNFLGSLPMYQVKWPNRYEYDETQYSIPPPLPNSKNRLLLRPPSRSSSEVASTNSKQNSQLKTSSRYKKLKQKKSHLTQQLPLESRVLEPPEASEMRETFEAREISPPRKCRSEINSKKYSYNKSNKIQRKKNKVKNLEHDLRTALMITRSLVTETNNDDRHEIFGKFVASELKRIKNDRICEEVRWNIQVVLREATQRDANQGRQLDS